MKVFEVVSAYIDEYCDDIGESYAVDKESVGILETYCSVIDEMIEDGWGSEFTVDVVGDDMLMSIEFSVVDFTYQPALQSKVYLDLIERAVSIDFSSNDGESVSVTFLFPSVFKHL